MKYIIRIKGKWPNAANWYHVAKDPGRSTQTNCEDNATKFDTAKEAFAIAKEYRKTNNIVRVCHYIEEAAK